MLKNIIGKKLKDIILSGYTEKGEEKYIFNPMGWWIYLKFQSFYIVISSNDGNITIEEQEEITCKFELEEEDFFTIYSWKKVKNNNYGTILNIDGYYDLSGNMVGLGLKTSMSYLLFNALDIDGFIISIENDDTLINKKISYGKKDIIY